MTPPPGRRSARSPSSATTSSTPAGGRRSASTGSLTTSGPAGRGTLSRCRWRRRPRRHAALRSKVAPLVMALRRGAARHLGLHEHANGVERTRDVVLPLGSVPALEEEREPGPLAVRIHPHPALVAARRAPLDPVLAVVGAERGLTVLLATFVAGVDLDAVTVGWPYGGDLRNEPRQVVHIRDRGVHRVRRRGDVLCVLVLHVDSSLLRKLGQGYSHAWHGIALGRKESRLAPTEGRPS